ncbi:MAG TPA: hypothetical protein VFN30_11080 [Chitinophagaceae bacterium]|nr:hypothetical protein [Chitinophagaceae bacterium]
MFRYERDMIPVLVKNLTKVFNTEYITTEFNTGNGVADLVFSTKLSEERLFFNDYGTMALFVNLFDKNKTVKADSLSNGQYDKIKLKKLLKLLEYEEYIYFEGIEIKTTRNYKPHTNKLISIEAKLKDWKSGFYQALRYKFFSEKSYLAFPKSGIHRVDIELLKNHNIGLIAVDRDKIEFILKPKTEKPQDKISYFFLSEMFAQKFKLNACA